MIFIGDQEREAWISWGSWKIGTAIGAAMWGVMIESRWGNGGVQMLLISTSSLCGFLTTVIICVTLITK